MSDHPKAPIGNKKLIISPEMIKEGTQYALTISPSDKRQYFDCVDRIDKLTSHIEGLLLEVPNVDFDMWMEVSRTGRLHFHGVICFKTKESIKHFYVIKINEWLSLHNLEMTTITDPKGWDEYCQKSSHLISVHITTKQVFDKYRKVKVDKNGIAHKPFF